MSEIADELERLASEFERKRDGHNQSAEVHKRDPDGLGWQTQHEISAEAWSAAAELIRARAAELRAQGSAPTYKPQPKPDSPWLAQWWGLDGAQPRRIASIDGRDGMHFVCFDGDPYPSQGDMLMQRVEILIHDRRWSYYGNGPEPTRR